MSDNQPLISIIVPVYNVEKYIRKCLDSIIHQTYRNLEIILVDDGSPDECGKICDEYAANDDRIRVIHKENGGLSDARNAGIEVASGEYLMFIDSDDYIDITMAETLYSLLQREHADMSVCNFCEVDEEGNLNADAIEQKYAFEGTFSAEDIFQSVLVNTTYFVIAWNKLYRSELLCNTRFPKGKLNEDLFTTHCIIDKCKSIACTDEVLYYYTRRRGSIVNSLTPSHLDRVEAYFKRADFAMKHNFNKFADVSFTAGLACMAFYRKQLDRSKAQIKNRISELKREYNENYFKILKRKIPLYKKILFTFCFLNIRFFDIFMLLRKGKDNE